MNLRHSLLGALALSLVATSASPISASLNADANAAFFAANAHKPGVRSTLDGIQFTILKFGDAVHPKNGDIVTVNFTLSLINGEQVAATEEDYAPQIPLNGPSLPPGAKEILKQMGVGERRKVWIPVALGFGAAGSPDGVIPPNQSLVYDIELLKVYTPPEDPHKHDKDNELPPVAPAAAR